jgi:undecaprenyl-diphosphatase
MDIQQFIAFDKELLLTLNGSHSLFLDGFFWTATQLVTWLPLAALLLYILIKNNGLWKGLLTVVLVALVIAVADQLASSVCKPFFQRLRPAQDGEIMYLVDVVNGYRGGRYGFVSSHAANTVALLVFLSLEVRNLQFTVIMAGWTLLNVYSRIYLGVHYPGDILFGALLGALVGYGFYALFSQAKRRFLNTPSYISNQYTAGGYATEDVSLMATFFLLTLFYLVIMGLATPYLLRF